jgi:hypothetical protein
MLDSLIIPLMDRAEAEEAEEVVGVEAIVEEVLAVTIMEATEGMEGAMMMKTAAIVVEAEEMTVANK